MKQIGRTMAMLLAGGAICAIPQGASANPRQDFVFDLPAQDLGDSLRAIAARAGWELYASAAEVNGRRAPALRGTLSAREAIEHLLSGSGLSARFTGKAVVIRGPASGSAADGQPDAAPIIVTGSRIDGANVAAPVTRVSRDAIVAAGQVDLGETMRALPANFGGGQNPGVGTGAGLINSNVNSATSANLRGLGPDATLTLLNGHRLPYDSAFGGVDVASIPVAALDRIEVVADGASAIYGSDAVAGVVNVILRRDYEGVATSTQLGASTDGGNVREQVDLVAGTRWSGGGYMLAYDFAHNTAIAARQRDYAGSLDPASSLYPMQRRHALTLAGHQDLGSGLSFTVDALYAKRWSTTVGGTASARYLFEPTVQTLSVAPELAADIGSGWSVRIQGAFGRDQTRYRTTFVPVAASSTQTRGCYCNRASSVEINAAGPLFAVAGGSASIAIGGGTRVNALAFSRESGVAVAEAFDVSRRSYYAFGELFVPFVAAPNAIRGIERLSLSAALRYEDYPGMARLATPRIGLVYAPVSALRFKTSWSRSFKAPTLYQQYVGYQAYLLPAGGFGVTPPGRTVLYASGGNPDLKPERARSWTAGVELRLPDLAGLLLEATYFNVRYRDRVVQPIAGSIAAAFRDPGYASLIDFAPGADLLDGLIGGAQLGLQNFTGMGYDPASVAAVVDNRNTNVAVQAIHGIDGHASWRQTVGDAGSVTFDLAGSWLASSQTLTDALPAVQLAGTVFNPPGWRVRGGATYQDRRMAASAFVNYTGGLADRRFAAAATLDPRATLDLAVRYDVIPGAGREAALAVSLVVNNLFDTRPQVIRTTGPTDTPYDSTNYSPVGRFVAIGLSRRW